MGADKLTPDQRFQKSLEITNSISDNIGLLLRCLTVVFIVWQLRVAFVALAGTNTKLVFQFLAHLTFSQGVAWTGCATGVGIGVAQQRLRKRATKKADAIIAELQSKIDPRRRKQSI